VEETFMRTHLVSFFALALAACGGSTETPVDPAAAGTDAAATDAAAAGTAAEAPAAVTCEAFGGHLRSLMDKKAEAAGDSEYMTVAQAKEFAGVMVTALIAGCNSNNRLGEFPGVVGCFMAAQDEAAGDACEAHAEYAGFDAYMKGLLASSSIGAPGAAGAAVDAAAAAAGAAGAAVPAAGH
jgi:hypothetical protein